MRHSPVLSPSRNGAVRFTVFSLAVVALHAPGVVHTFQFIPQQPHRSITFTTGSYLDTLPSDHVPPSTTAALMGTKRTILSAAQLGNENAFVTNSTVPQNIGQPPPPPQTTYNTENVQQTVDTGSNTDTNNNNDDSPEEPEPELPSLYEILGASPNATRSELKRSYAVLAKQTHPDAMILNQYSTAASSDEILSSQYTFQQINEAYKTLSDPLQRKRYDRELRAKTFTNNVEQYVEDFGRRAAPEVSRVFQKVVNPILRRGAVTTMAGISAVVGSDGTDDGEVGNDGFENNGQKKKNLGSIFDRAVKAGLKAGKVIDRLELVEKSNELQERAMEEERKSLTLKDQLSNIIIKRINLSLRTPNSSLSSLDALQLLDGMNTVDSVSTLDRIVRLRHTISYEIELLQQCESEYDTLTQQHEIVQQEVQESQSAIVKARNNVEAALVAEARARKALEDAIALVASTKQDVMDCSQSLNVKEELYRRTGNEVERVALNLTRRQERVRLSLRRKEEEIENEQNNNVDMYNYKEGSLFPNGAGGQMVAGEEQLSDEEEDYLLDTENALAKIEQYRKEERFILAESARSEDKAMRLRSRCGKLLERADAIETEEDLRAELAEDELKDIRL